MSVSILLSNLFPNLSSLEDFSENTHVYSTYASCCIVLLSKNFFYCLAMWGLSWTTTDVWKDSSYKLWKDHMVISLYLSTFSYMSPRFSFFTLNWLLSLLWFTTFIEPAVSKIKVPYIVNWGVDLVRVHKDLGCYSLKERFIFFVQMLLQPVIIPGRLLGSLFAGHMLRVRT